MVRTDAQGFELDQNDFVKLTKKNAKLAQRKVDQSAKDLDGKKSSKTRKTLSAIREDDYSKNELYLLIQEKGGNDFSDGFLEIIKKINDTNSTRLSNEEQEHFAYYITSNKSRILKEIKKGNTQLVNELAAAGTLTKKRYNFSFTSKFCTYISRYLFNEYDKFTPYDRVIQNILPYYAWAYCKIENIPNFKDKRKYDEYIELIRKIIARSQKLYGKEGSLSLKEFDRLLWYKYKGLLGEDLIGRETSLLKAEK